MSEKKGIDLILDRIEALRVRIDRAIEVHSEPPRTVGDERLVDTLQHWGNLVVEALVATKQLAPTIDVIAANLALSRDAPPAEIAQAVRLCVHRCQELEAKLIEFQDSHKADRLKRSCCGTPMDKPHVNGCFGATFERMVSQPSEGRVATVGPTLGGEYLSPDPNEGNLHVLEKLECLVLSAWLDDAARKLKFVHEYMAANESRMSEDLFDELRVLEGKIGGWAYDIRLGNLFPR